MSRIATFVTGFLVCLTSSFLAPVGRAQGQTPGTRYYYYKGEPQAIQVRTDRVAVRFPEAAPSGEQAAFLDRHRDLGVPLPDKDFSFVGIAILQLIRPETAQGIEAIAAQFRADPTLSGAWPVYQVNGADIVPTGRIFLQLREGRSEDLVSEILDRYDLSLIRRTPWTDGNFVLETRRETALDAIAIAEELTGHPDVTFCEPDFLSDIGSLSPPDDPLFPTQWNLQNFGQIPGTNEDADLDAPEGWEIQRGLASVRIAVLDFGIETAHPDLATSIDGANAWDFIENDNDPNPGPGEFKASHGTNVAGIAAAILDNHAGIAGAAGGSKIIPVRMIFADATSNDIAAAAIGHAFTHQADVINCSWRLLSQSNQVDLVIHLAVTKGRQGKGTVVCFGAGNEDMDPIEYPARLKEVIAVGATSPCDERKSFLSCENPNPPWGSSYGVDLDVAAPGVHIATTTIGATYVSTFDGTSAACPHVAGLAALLIAKFPDYEGTEIRARIEQTCDKVGGYAYDPATGKCLDLGYGRINMYRALSGKPQVIRGAMPNHPSVYRDASDARGYSSAIHESAAYEWLGEEFSPEVSPGDPDDPDGVRNLAAKDAFDDGVFFSPPYIPSLTNQVTFKISVEDHTSIRYNNRPLYLNCWVDWEADGNWSDPFDWMVVNQTIQPSNWSGDTETITIPIQVPGAQIDWHVQSGQPGKFLNVRARLTYDTPLVNATETATWGEVEDHSILNFVEMFDGETGAHYTVHQGFCDPWEWVNGGAPWLPITCQPPFLPTDGPVNGYMTACIYNPIYVGDDDDRLRTPAFDLSELTEARVQFQYSAVELAYGRVVIYVNGFFRATLRVYNGVVTSDQGPCKLVFTDVIDLTPYTGDGYNDVYLAFEVAHDEPCGIPLPTYQDWFIDNVVVVGVDAIRPAPTAPTVTRVSDWEADLTWPTPGDDGGNRRAELYNIRYSPRTIDAQSWRHDMWVRKDMVNALPIPQAPGTQEFLDVRRLESGLHHFCVRTIDEVNLIAPIQDGGTNHPPTITLPAVRTPTDDDTLQFVVTAADPDFDALFLSADQLPAGATFRDNGDNTGTFEWIILPDQQIGSHTMTFSAEDWNGAVAQETLVIAVIPDNIAPDGSDHDAGAYLFTVTSHGTLGFLDTSTRGGGSGFVYPKNGGTNHLYIGGLWVGESATYVANRDYDADPEREWRTAVVPDGHMQAGANGHSDQDWVGKFTDNYAGQPRGLFVEQESWAYASPPNDDDFCIIRYTVQNRGSAALSALYAGCFVDFDLRGDGNDDRGGADGGRKLLWMTDGSGVYTGIRMLERGGGTIPSSNLTLVANPTYVWPNQYILDADKDAFLKASDPQHVLTDGSTPLDYSLLAAAGPFDLPPGQSKEVTFAVIGAMSLSALAQNADRAQAVYAAETSDVVENGSDGRSLSFELLGAVPNPFLGGTLVSFGLVRGGPIRLEVYDLAGRRIRTLLDDSRPPGRHALSWDGHDGVGRAVASGTYYIRLEAPEGQRSRSVKRLR